MVKLLFWLPGEMAKQFRSKSAETMIRYLGGDLTLIDEIKQIDNHHVTNPNNVSQIFREEVQQNQILFSQDEINNSRRLLEHFGSMNNIFYMLAFKHQEENYAKTGVVRDSRQLHTRYGEHQSEFGEVCLHLAIQCSDINTVETEFKQTSFFRTNKVSNIPRKRGGFHTEILKLSELVTTETIKEKMKLVAGDRITDPPPMYTQETTNSSLEIEKERTIQIQEKEKTRQIEIQKSEETKQLQIQADKELEMKKLELAHQLELKKLEMKITPKETEKLEEPTPVVKSNKKPQMTIVAEDQESVIDLVKKFIDTHSRFSTNREDYIFIDDLFNRFQDWYNCMNPSSPSPIGKVQLSRILSRLQEFKIMRISIGPRVGNNRPRKVGLVNRKFISS